MSSNELPHVLHVVRSAGTGGVETHVRLMCELYRAAGGKASVVCLTPDKPDPVFVAATHDFTQLNDTETWSKRSIVTVRDLYRYMQRSPADVVHVHGARPIFAGALAARAAGKKHIVASLHGSTDLMAVRADGSTTTLGLLFARFVHGLGFVLSKRIVVCATRLKEDVNRCLRLFGPFGMSSHRKIRVVYHGIETAPSAAEAPPPRQAGTGRLRVGTLSRLDEPKKGIAFLIRAVKSLQDAGTIVSLRIAGNGYSRKDLEHLAATLALADCQFVGFVKDPRDFYRDIDVFVLSSLSEGMPLVNLEAMACGVPVITTDVGGAAEAVLDGQSGLVVPPADPDSLARAIGRLESNRAEAARLAAAGQDRVMNNFTVATTFSRLQSVYAEGTTRRPEKR
jgi:glycosyltransferase involved in cell wall biosynthesis